MHPRVLPVARLFLGVLCSITLLFSADAAANERLFTYIDETPVLPLGEAELEPWITTSIGRSDYYFQMDNRLEFEWGLGKGIQTALYLNHRVTAEAADSDGDGVYDSVTRSSVFRGFSSEVKFSFTDPVADPVGLAAYFEVGVQPHEIEFEPKFLLDKALGPALLALNLVGELEVKPQPKGTPTGLEGKFIGLFGTSFRLTQGVHLGFELRSLTAMERTEDGGTDVELSLLSLGPTLSVSGKKAWVAMTVLPQLVDLAAGRYNLDTAEAVEARFLVGIHL